MNAPSIHVTPERWATLQGESGGWVAVDAEIKTDPDSVGRAFAAVLNEGRGAGVKHLIGPPAELVAASKPCETCDGDILLAGEFGVNPLGIKVCPTCKGYRKPLGAIVTECPTCEGARPMSVERGRRAYVHMGESDIGVRTHSIRFHPKDDPTEMSFRQFRHSILGCPDCTNGTVIVGYATVSEVVPIVESHTFAVDNQRWTTYVHVDALGATRWELGTPYVSIDLPDARPGQYAVKLVTT